MGLLLAVLGLLALGFKCRRAALALAIIPLAVGLATLIESVFAVDLGFDRWLLYPLARPGLGHYRMAPQTTLTLFLTGLALVIGSRLRPRLASPALALLGALVGGVGAGAAIGYAAGLPAAYGWGHLTAIAFPAATACVLIGMAMIAHAAEILPERNEAGIWWAAPIVALVVSLLTVSIYAGLHRMEAVWRSAHFPIAPGITPYAGPFQGSYLDEMALVLGISLGLLLATALHYSQKFRRSAAALQRNNQVLLSEMAQREAVAATLEHSEERLRLATDAAGVGTWEWNPVTGEQILSAAARSLLGGGVSDHPPPRTLWERVPAEDREGLEEAFDKAIAGDQDFKVEYRVAWPDGSIRWVAAQGRAVRSPSGQVTRMSGVVLDITERRRAQEQLRLQASALRAAANAIMISSRDGNILWVNPAFTVLTGYRPDEVVGQNPRILKSGQQPQSVYEELWETIREGRVWRGEVINKRKDGTLYPEEMTITPVSTEGGSITHFIAIKQDISRRKRAEESLRRAEENYRQIVDSAVVGFYQSSPNGRFLTANQSLAHMLGYDSPDELIRNTRDMAMELYVDPAVRLEFRREIESKGEVRDYQSEMLDHTGKHLWVAENARAVRDLAGTILYYEGTLENITQRKQLELQLHQAQKMEAVGRLAGGIAHDFNNLLNIISGFTELLCDRIAPEDPRRHHLDKVMAATRRAASLVSQLLAFSRKQVLCPRVLDLNQILAELKKMLPRLIGEDINLVFQCSPDLRFVKVDPTQMEQIILNLAINARDAMPNGGFLRVETQNASLDESYCDTHSPAQPGNYVVLAVSDNGIGMDETTRARIFEPFYTTKEAGKGTGLGLATVYGIVKQSGGFIWVYSEEGVGTTFKIYLPQAQEEASQTEKEAVLSVSAGGSETILLVEDEDALREAGLEYLQSLGYNVLAAKNGKDALDQAANSGVKIDLLLTDVVMPEMGGRELSETLRANGYPLRTIYMSGYTDDSIVHYGVLEAGVHFIQKPFAFRALEAKIREVLETPPKTSTSETQGPPESPGQPAANPSR